MFSGKRRMVILLCVSIMMGGSVQTLFADLQTQKAVVDSIYEEFEVLDEWNKPGLYSPANMFDDDVSTCFAEGDRHDQFTIRLSLKKEIECDEIGILGGLAKSEELFEHNNRPKIFSIYFYSGGNGYAFNRDNLKDKKEFTLEDKMEYQSLSLDGVQEIKNIVFQCISSYRGTKYNDTCVTELKFYYKGEEIPVENVSGLKRKYVKDVGRWLSQFFALGKFGARDTGYIAKAVIGKNGDIRYTETRQVKKYGFIMPTRVEVHDSRLYITLSGKRELVRYSLVKEKDRRILIYNARILQNGQRADLIFEPLEAK
jgi:hypothetical protein